MPPYIVCSGDGTGSKPPSTDNRREASYPRAQQREPQSFDQSRRKNDVFTLLAPSRLIMFLF